MIFLSSWALWLLSLGAVIAMVYFLKRQARLMPVSALFLWRGREQNPKSALRWHWTQLVGLFLQLLALTALALTVAQPILYTRASGVRSLAIVLDGSASMRTRIDPHSPTAYQKAIDAGLELLRANPAAEVTVIQAQTHSALLVPPTKDHAQAQRAITASSPTYQGDSDLSDLLSLLQSQSPQGFEQVVYLTDHHPSFDAAALGWELQIVGGAQAPENVAITRFAAREHPNARGYDLYLEAWNSSHDTRRIPLRITADGQLLDERFVELAPHRISPYALQYEGPLASQFVAQLITDGIGDDWAEDNVRYAVPPQARPWKILWIGESNFYLERFLRFSGYADLALRPSWDEALSPAGYDVILLYRTDLPKGTAGRFLSIQSAVPPWVTLGSTIEVTDDAIEARTDHPLLAGLDPRDWRLLRAQEASVSPLGQVLLTVGEIPLLYVHNTAGLRLAYFGIDLMASNVGVSIDFPILIYRLLSWLAPTVKENANLQIGQELSLVNSEGTVRIVDPQGQTCDFPSEDAHCGLVEQPGFYHWINNGVTRSYAANVPSQESLISDLSPHAANLANVHPTRTAEPAPAGTDLRAAIPLWPYLLGVALLLLLMELWHFDPTFFSLQALREWRRRRP